MKHFFTFFIASCVVMFMVASCGSYSPSKEYAAIADELEKNSDNYTIDEWEAIIQHYESVIEASEGCEFSNEELEEIGKQQGRCLAYITKGYAKLAAQKGASYLHQLKGLVDGFKEEFGDGSDIQDSIMDALGGLLNED